MQMSVWWVMRLSQWIDNLEEVIKFLGEQKVKTGELKTGVH